MSLSAGQKERYLTVKKMGPQLIFDRLNDVESLEIAALLQAALKAFTASGVMAEVSGAGS